MDNNWVFEIIPETREVYVVKSYRLMEDGTEVDPCRLTFVDQERALTYVKNVVGRLKECTC
jgi:hypothetical protein